ncbi:hypothetical protein HGP28_05480 [Vibrio sp. SM6]|uniref:Uncharacterized protein n=1 Tax=Vibrio agarilyticus TaxID=2726741 RepID=A0A7X8TPN3_9VIBR|nr:hypothetical protein [Vibrio agarilyticus]NLS12347.1 hypothetical protein [Vibrio agarilyticus]
MKSNRKSLSWHLGILTLFISFSSHAIDREGLLLDYRVKAVDDFDGKIGATWCEIFDHENEGDIGTWRPSGSSFSYNRSTKKVSFDGWSGIETRELKYSENGRKHIYFKGTRILSSDVVEEWKRGTKTYQHISTVTEKIRGTWDSERSPRLIVTITESTNTFNTETEFRATCFVKSELTGDFGFGQIEPIPNTVSVEIGNPNGSFEEEGEEDSFSKQFSDTFEKGSSALFGDCDKKEKGLLFTLDCPTAPKRRTPIYVDGFGGFGRG